MAMVQRLRARFRVPADLLLPPPKMRRPGVRPNEWRPDSGLWRSASEKSRARRVASREIA